MEELLIRASILFILTFFCVYIFYYFWTVKKAKKKIEEPPIEVKYLLLKYKINLKDISYGSLLNTVALVGSLDIALVVSLVSEIDGTILPLVVGFGTLIPVIAVTFHFVGRFYQKKGKIKDENNSRNRK